MPNRSNSLLILLDTLKKKYKIPQENFIGHGDIAPGRKVDPRWRFPWKQLADHGFGDWYDDTTGVIIPAGFNDYQALRIIGYNLKDSVAAVAAFRRHWLQDSVYKVFDSASEKILYSLSLNTNKKPPSVALFTIHTDIYRGTNYNTGEFA